MRIDALLLLVAFAAVGVPPASSDETLALSGTVRDGSGHPLAGSSVVLDGGATHQADAAGGYRLRAAPGEHVVRASHAGYRSATSSVTLASDTDGVDLVLEPLHRLSEEVIVQAIRADAQVPVTKKDVDHEEIEARNFGQEMPFLLSQAPSITLYSENGSGAGYSYLYLRGLHQTRVNMTLDGVPLNDPEESAVYFSNFGDFASAVDSVQIQRGVGTSTVGSASYAGSINFASAELAEHRELSGEAGAGSFGSVRGTVAAQSGRWGPGLALYGRASYQTTDGFRERSGVRQHTFFLGASWQGRHSLLKLFAFSGRERTQLSFLPEEKAVLERDLRFNSLSSEERDAFGQDFLQLQLTRFLSASTSLAGQAYYNGAQGWFRLWDDPVARGALDQYGLDGQTVGALLTLHHATESRTLTWGVHVNHFARDHFLDVVDGARAYTNTGEKSEANSFVKLGQALGRWHLYADAQLRHATFRYVGRVPLGSVSWTFLDPKLGTRWDATPSVGLYLAVGRAIREPTRNDLLAGEDDATVVHDLHGVRPERVTDVEAGADWRHDAWELHANVYAMEFRNEIAATGELSEIGLLLRRNVDRSFRRGLELDGRWRPSSHWRLALCASLSRNRIRRWTQFYDVVDSGGAFVGRESRVYDDVSPLLTPTAVVSPEIEWAPVAAAALDIAGRFVSRAYLDNTSNDAFAAPAFFDLDATASLGLARWIHTGQPRLRVRVTNLLDNHRMFPSGASLLVLVRDAAGAETLAGTSYYYPLATRAVVVSVGFRL